MIKIRSRGRLGNQLFIYSFARSLSIKTNQSILLYDRKDEEDDFSHSRLSNYILCDKIKFTSNEKDVLPREFHRKLLFYFNRVLGKYFLSPKKFNRFEKKLFNKYLKFGLFLLKDGYIEIPENINNKEIFCDGYFQSPKYFDEYRDIIVTELVPKKNMKETNLVLIDKMKKCESVCLTIRLGDYLNNPVHGVCDLKYYQNAIEIIKNKVENPVFFIFSDDINLVKEKLNFDAKIVFQNNDNEDFEHLQSMSYCKHFIISNSSYSWWAQYLSDYKDKIVVSPKKWYAKNIPCDIYENEWINI